MALWRSAVRSRLGPPNEKTPAASNRAGVFAWFARCVQAVEAKDRLPTMEIKQNCRDVALVAKTGFVNLDDGAAKIPAQPLRQRAQPGVGEREQVRAPRIELRP